MTSLQRCIRTIWGRKGWTGKLGWLVLAPLSCGFSLIARGRNQLYSRRWLSVHHPTLKVVSVGNLTVGGTGKTPVVLWLAHALRAHGHNVGILSRGYKGANTQAPVIVGAGGQLLATPEEAGDEPIMLARSFPGVVIACRHRMAGIQLAQEQFGVDIVILDDGFQHRRLGRDVDILLFNSQNELPNHWLLPAGPFREPLSAARRADVVIITKGDVVRQGETPTWLQRVFPYQQSIYSGRLEPVALVSTEQRQWRELPLTALSGKRILALAGIADPAPFYQTLQEWGAKIVEVMEFSDHYQYAQTDWQAISALGQKVDLIVTTEKDLVKLERFPFATGKLVALRVRMSIDREDLFLAEIERRLTNTE
ncbi:MAG TPA: tetraacyldisaccharide 4'-kinase [Methylomirabilota bacterium]|jgi:tetraacyldisaccharide 4'-kinase|nr:tetraacyldisaccharide 4'-kinase [Methylomirabilota bacterium]